MAGPRYTETEARSAVAESRSLAETLGRLGMCRTGGATKILRKYLDRWGIATDHFDTYASTRTQTGRGKAPLEQILVERSGYPRWHLKRRLYEEGLKTPVCEHCGQGEIWRGQKMSMILDHATG